MILSCALAACLYRATNLPRKLSNFHQQTIAKQTMLPVIQKTSRW